MIIFAAIARGKIFSHSLKQWEWIKKPKDRHYRSSSDERSLTQYSNKRGAGQCSGVWHLCLYCGGECRSRILNLFL